MYIEVLLKWVKLPLFFCNIFLKDFLFASNIVTICRKKGKMWLFPSCIMRICTQSRMTALSLKLSSISAQSEYLCIAFKVILAWRPCLLVSDKTQEAGTKFYSTNKGGINSVFQSDVKRNISYLYFNQINFLHLIISFYWQRTIYAC